MSRLNTSGQWSGQLPGGSFLPKPPLTAFRRKKELRDYLIRAKTKENTEKLKVSQNVASRSAQHVLSSEKEKHSKLETETEISIQN